jgi:hypothetical protein
VAAGPPGRGGRAAAFAGALAASLAHSAACGGGPSERPAGNPGAAAARGLAAAIEAAATLRATWRCAGIAGGGGAGTGAAATAAGPGAGTAGPVGAGERAWQRAGATVTATRARLVIAAVAQARGAEPPAGLRAAIAGERPDLVLALGGMGGDRDELARALAALAVPGALLVAVPGDSEPWPALTAAVDELAARGVAIVDGARVRTIDAGVAVVATLPGLAHPGRLAAGADGCVHDEEDVAATLGALAAAAGDRPRVLAAARAPQGDDERGGGELLGGVHAGDPALAAALAPAGLTLVVHGLADRPAAAGDAGPGAGAAIAAGSLDPGPRWDGDGRPLAPVATIAIVDGRGARWRSLPSAGR